MQSRYATINWWLLAVSLVAAVPRLYLGATQFIEYDGYWHVFIASQDNWHQFYKEYQSNFHPPLFYLLLKVAMLFGHSRLVYRAISILSGVGAVYVMGKIAERISFHRYTPVIAALAYGLGLPSIIISCEVRSYMLSVFFILLSFYYFLDSLDGPGGTPVKSRALFALFAALAGYSHYGAFLYIGACVGVAAWFDLFWYRHGVGRRLGQDVATFGAIAVALAYVYLTHGRPHAGIAEHLRAYYLPTSQESLWTFLVVNTHHMLNSFSPVPFPLGTPFFLIAVALLAAGAYLVYSIRRLSETQDLRAAGTVLLGACLLLLIVIGGIAGKYPYGGELRQQFFLFPFAILAACVAFDRILHLASATAARVLLFSAVIIILGSSSFAFAEYPKTRPELGTIQMKIFRRDFPAPPAVYVDQFNLINFFTHYHDWRWAFVSNCRSVPSVSVYRVTKGAQSMLVLRDLPRWSLDLREQALYEEIAKCIKELNLPSLTIFFTRHEPAAVPVQQEPELGDRILTMTAANSLCVSKLRVVGARVYASLVPGQCVPDVEARQKCSKCDDTNWAITYRGNWQRGELEWASNSTLTYTNDAAALLQFSFDGTELRYWYAKAPNFGWATVVIDGVMKGIVNLYSPKIEWQSVSDFRGLAPGHHTVEIRATGRHSPQSSDSYIDIDALEAR